MNGSTKGFCFTMFGENKIDKNLIDICTINLKCNEIMAYINPISAKDLKDSTQAYVYTFIIEYDSTGQQEIRNYFSSINWYNDYKKQLITASTENYYVKYGHF